MTVGELYYGLGIAGIVAGSIITGGAFWGRATASRIAHRVYSARHAEYQVAHDRMVAEATARIDGQIDQVCRRMDSQSARLDEISANIGGIRERLGRIEGRLNGRIT